MIDRVKFKLLFTVTCLLMALSCRVVCGGALDDFKKGASRDSKTSSGASGNSSSISRHHHPHYIYGDTYWYGDRYWYGDGYWSRFHDRPFYAFGDMFFYGMAYGGVSSWARVNRMPIYPDDGEYAEGLTPVSREAGEAVIPFVRLDVTYQAVRSEVDALDYSIDGGYGPVGLRFNRVHFRERHPDDTMDLTQVYGLYRMSLGRSFEVDLGLGGFSVRGEDNDRFAFTMPVLYHPSKHFGFEFRPAWAGNISEYDAGVLLGARFVSLKCGYRWLSGPSLTLSGPYAGLSLRF